MVSNDARRPGTAADEAQLEELFRRHFRAVESYVIRGGGAEVAEDVVAETSPRTHLRFA